LIAVPLAVGLIMAAEMTSPGRAGDDAGAPATVDTVGTAGDHGADSPSDEAPAVTEAGSLPEPVAAVPVPPPTVPPGTASGEPVTLAFGGDIAYQNPPGSPPIPDPADRLRPMEPLLAGADLAVVNLETAITERGTPVDKDFTFRAPASVLDSLATNGVDVVSMANNHGLDYGEEGLWDSLAAKAESPVAIIGIGADEDEAFAPHIAEVKGQRVAVIGATQVLDRSVLDAWTATPTQGGLASAKRVDRLVWEVARARAEADTVVVFLHWGIERETCPSDVQQELAFQLVAAGADVIVGGHAHRVQGGGRMGDAVVNYGLGNFAFNAASPEASATGVFEVTVAGRDVQDYKWQPGVIVDQVPYPLEGEQADAALADWHQLRACTGLNE